MATATAPTATTAVTQNEWWKDPASTGVMGTVTNANAATTTAPADANAATTAAPGGATAATYDPNNWNVDSKQTVQGQVGDIIAADSPLMQRAATRADQQMNRRGLMNSSMAVGAGQSAVMDAAMPIATADAQTNAQSANFNANAANTSAQFNAGNQQQVNLTNEAATNRANEFNASNQQQTTLANTAATNRANEFDAGNVQQTSLANAGAANAAMSESNKIRQQAATLNQDAGNKLLMQDLDNKFKTAISNADSATKLEIQALADTTKRDLAGMEATYKQMIASNDQAGALYGKVMQNITDIVNNPDIVAADKTTAIENQKTMLKTGMDVVSAVSGLDLGAILDFGP
jgi:hypothetical protein